MLFKADPVSQFITNHLLVQPGSARFTRVTLVKSVCELGNFKLRALGAVQRKQLLEVVFLFVVLSECVITTKCWENFLQFAFMGFAFVSSGGFVSMTAHKQGI